MVLALPETGVPRSLGESLRIHAHTGSASLVVPIQISSPSRVLAPLLELTHDPRSGRTLFGVGWSLSVGSVSRCGLPRYEETDEFVLTGEEVLVPVGARRIEGGLAIDRYCPRVARSMIRVEKITDLASAEVHWRTISRDQVTSIYGRAGSTRISDPEDVTHVFRWLIEESFDDRGNRLVYEYERDRGANRCIKRIRYGNDRDAWRFQVGFEYSERADPYSKFRSGFEIRTQKICRRIVNFHQFDELGRDPVPVRAWNFQYREDPAGSMLASIQEVGYRSDGTAENAPPLQLRYQRPPHVEPPPPPPLDEPARELPPLARLPGSRLVSLTGDETQQLVHYGPPLPGYQERSADSAWGPFCIFRSLPRLDFTDPGVRFADLDGDGRADLLAGEYWYPSLGKSGFGEPRKLFLSPEVSLADPQVHLADMTGDGQLDVVRVAGGEVCYWPNLGYGRFGAKVVAREPVNSLREWLLSGFNNSRGLDTELEYQIFSEGPRSVPVLTRVVCVDQTTGASTITGYRYRHLFHDAFARVEVETQKLYADARLAPPPSRTITWYDLGAHRERAELAQHRAAEYPAELADASLPDDLSFDDEREALRALCGRPLVEATYSGADAVPLVVRELAASVLRMHPRAYLAIDRESLESISEQQANDPRVIHRAVLRADELGNALHTIELAHPRRDATEPEQSRMYATSIERRFDNSVRGSVPLEERRYELTGLFLRRLNFGALRAAVEGATPIAFDDTPRGGRVEKRLIAHQRWYYYGDDDVTALPFGSTGRRALLREVRRRALTTALIRRIFGPRIGDPREGYYRLEDGDWWISSGIIFYDPARYYLPVRFESVFGQIFQTEYDQYSILPVRELDPLLNTTQAANDYRALVSALIVDANENRSAVELDGFGRVVAVALLGKPGSNETNTLADPTRRIEYHDAAPSRVTTLARESFAVGSQFLESRVYFDGAGRAILRKQQAEQQRWIASRDDGVKTWSPQFSAGGEYEDASQSSPATLVHRDALGRTLAIEYPDGRSTRTAYGAWQRTSWDENQVQTIEHLDPLGRVFLKITGNGVKTTRLELDIFGRELRGDGVERAFDLLGREIWRNMADAGERRIFFDAAGKIARAWDALDDLEERRYDALERPIEVRVRPLRGKERIVEKTSYGESVPSAAQHNLRGRVHRRQDSAGISIHLAYDLSGNVRRASRQVLRDFRRPVDWASEAMLETEILEVETIYDPLGRLARVTWPDRTEIQYVYDRAGWLKAISARPRGQNNAVRFLEHVEYDAAGRPLQVDHANGTRLRCEYDPLSSRLLRLETVRTRDVARLLDLSYTYDPAGNITVIRDDAQQTIFFNNARIEPHASYVYDVLYRLIQAEGREYFLRVGERQPDSNDNIVSPVATGGDGQSLRRYVEYYAHDAAGKLTEVRHVVGGAVRWSRQTAAPAYNANGCMTKTAHLPRIEWDHRRRIREVDLGGGGLAFYAYDSEGRRVRKVVERGRGAVIQDRIYLGDFEVYRERRGGGTTDDRRSLHLFVAGRRFAIVDTFDAGSARARSVVRYQATNHAGSTLVETDETGAVLSYEEYHPLGTSAYYAARTPKRFRWQGQERDDETSLYYDGAQYYAPWLGCWTSVEPGGDPR